MDRNVNYPDYRTYTVNQSKSIAETITRGLFPVNSYQRIFFENLIDFYFIRGDSNSLDSCLADSYYTALE